MTGRSYITRRSLLRSSAALAIASLSPSLTGDAIPLSSNLAPDLLNGIASDAASRADYLAVNFWWGVWYDQKTGRFISEVGSPHDAGSPT